jgi:Glycosyltransferase family 17
MGTRMGLEGKSRISEYCLFNGEQLVADIKLNEHSCLVDEFHFVESTRTFKNGKRSLSFSSSSNKVNYRIYYPGKEFTGNSFRPALPPRFLKTNLNPWKNETVIRNFLSAGLKPRKEDILILSDIDEIIDARHLPRVIAFAQEHGVATIKVHFTLYFFNLFSENYVGPEDYSYRIFIMTGEYYNKMTVTPDELRKMGEAGDLTNKIKCYPDFAGFHHSWIGDAKFVASKLSSYSHGPEDHDSRLFRKGSHVELSVVEEFLKGKKSMYGTNHRLSIRNDIPMLASVERLRETSLSRYFATEG